MSFLSNLFGYFQMSLYICTRKTTNVRLQR
nr:MAG TPA: hypothetical protein [Caudoviricetes sp.]